MARANNDTHETQGPTSVGLIADDEDAIRFAEALRANPAFELIAVGGMSQETLAGVASWHDDLRVLVAQGGVEALVIASSPRVGVRMAEVAAAYGVHVWRPPPLGRGFAEAVEAARTIKNSESVHRIGSWWDHAAAEIEWALSHSNDRGPLYSDVWVSAAGPTLQSWRSSAVDSAGGVLATDAYAHLEALAAARGVPESVSGAISRRLPPTFATRRETEDVAGAILRYEDNGLAIVRTTWDTPPFGAETRHHGCASSVVYTDDRVAVLGAEGRAEEERMLPGGCVAAELERFADEIRGRAEPSPAAITRHLTVSAILETVYLSARTGQPEQPRRLFEVQKWPEPER